jgi:carbohydrate binding protein with CBM4/9 domain
MTSPGSASSALRSIKSILAVTILLCGQGLSIMAQAPKSLLPAFGNEGAEFTTKAQNNNVVHGWLPNEWKDNSEWAPVSATYTKLTDSPDKATGAVRIKIEKVEEGGQLQLTTYQGNQKYQKGTHYVATGWVRSPDQTSVKLGARQMNEPYEFYHEQELPTGPEWKRFEFAFTPTMDFTAFLMFVVREVGTVDLAGVFVQEKR